MIYFFLIVWYFEKISLEGKNTASSHRAFDSARPPIMNYQWLFNQTNFEYINTLVNKSIMCLIASPS